MLKFIFNYFFSITTDSENSDNFLPTFNYLREDWIRLYENKSEIYVIGYLIYGDFFFPFILLSIIITTVLIGSIFSTRENIDNAAKSGIAKPKITYKYD